MTKTNYFMGYFNIKINEKLVEIIDLQLCGAQNEEHV